MLYGACTGRSRSHRREKGARGEGKQDCGDVIFRNVIDIRLVLYALPSQFQAWVQRKRDLSVFCFSLTSCISSICSYHVCAPRVSSPGSHQRQAPRSSAAHPSFYGVGSLVKHTCPFSKEMCICAGYLLLASRDTVRDDLSE